MKAIELKHKDICTKITFGRIKPFKNICKVTGEEEYCNISIEYVPNGLVLDVVSYREFFNKKFNSLIEDIAVDVFGEIKRVINPKHLKVTVFLEGNPYLTDWNCSVED